MKITISKRSWHYRLYEFLHHSVNGKQCYFDPPKSLCPYFWGFILMFLKALFMYGVFYPILLVIATSPIWTTIHGLFYPSIQADFLTIGCVGSATLFFCLHMRDKYEYSVNKIGFLRITKEVIKSAFTKICPMVEYTEE